MPTRRGVRRLLAALLGLVVVGCAPRAPNCSDAAPPAVTVDPGAEVLVGAGDIATGEGDCDEATARLLDVIPGTVFTAGDNVYPSGSRAEFERHYEPTWGRHKARTHPVPGNHDYRTNGGGDYFAYFGGAAGEPGRAYRSFDLGAWHVVLLDSNCAMNEGGCAEGSAQERWLRADLAAADARCTVAIWHAARFSSGPHGGAQDMDALWRVLHEHGVELLISGHDHAYERFAPMDAEGWLDRQTGVRQIVVGTGGARLHRFERTSPNSEVASDATFGVLVLELFEDRYDWRFVPVAGSTFTDAGSTTCH